MRRFLPILLSVLGLIACFVVYLQFQPKFNLTIPDKPPPDEFSSGGGGTFVKPGHGAWVVQYDKEGRRANQFKAEYYDNQPDGTVKVTKPVIEFFLSNEQILHIEGVDGIVRLAPGADKGALGSLSGAPHEPPRYGKLNHVVVKLFGSAAQQRQGLAELTITMTNAQFDNDTYRLFTDEYIDAAGKVIYADQVPVTAWSRDYYFQGWGMVIYWNDLDKRLKSLEIAHMRDLTIYHPGSLTGQEASPATRPVAPARAGAAGVTTAPSPDKGTPRQRYLATFFDNIQVQQAGQTLLHAPREMTVDFIPTADNGPTSQPSTAPSASPATISAAPSQVLAQAPMHVYWAGKMRLVPVEDPAAEPLAQGKAIVQLLGQPVLLRQPANGQQPAVDAQCASAIYRTADSSIHLEGDAQTPLKIIQTRLDGSIAMLTGQALDYSRQAGLATVHGPGQAQFPDAKDPKTMLKTSWKRQCIAHLSERGKGQMQIEDADLFGDVVADHPRFHLTAGDDLALTFDSSVNSSTPQLHELVARGGAACVVHQANRHDRNISGQTLQLVTAVGADGKTYPRQVDCAGAVVARQDEQQLQAEHLQVTLRPSAEKNPNAEGDDEMANVALDQLTATGNVRLTGKNSSSASADRLDMQMVDEHPRITLSGQARVADKTSLITGPVIHLSPHEKTASVDGPGTLDTLQKNPDPSRKPKPLHLAWHKNADIDGQANSVTVVGDAFADSKNPDGSDDTANAGQILVTLVDVASSTRPGEDSPASRPADADVADLGEMDFLKTKQVQKLTLLPQETAPSATTRPTVRIGSELKSAGGLILHQYDLWGERIDYDAALRRLTVPGPGTIRAAQHQPPATRPTTQPDSAAHGDTEIIWQKQFVYDQPSQTAVIEGEVAVAHLNDGKDPQPVRLEGAARVTVELQPDGSAATQPTAPAGAAEPAAMKIRRVVATGPITIATADKTIYCGQVEFDPVNSRLICRGGGQGRVTVVDNQNLTNSGTFGEIWLNIATNKLEKLVNFSGRVR